MNALTVIPTEVCEGTIVEGYFLEPNPFKTASWRFVEADTSGWTLADYARDAAGQLDSEYGRHIDLWIDEERMDPAHWHRVKPKQGHTVYARVRPRGKGAKNILRSVIMIAIVVAATYFLGPGSAFIGSLGLSGFAATAASAFIVAGVSMVGMLAVNALIPAPGLTGRSDNDPRYSLTGSSNRYTPYQPVPRPFGKLRMFPVIAGHPWTEWVGKRQYLRMLLCFGWGPLKISDIRIGNTPITAFRNTQYEVHEGGPAGWAGNKAIRLYNRRVTENTLSRELIHNIPSAFETTDPNTVTVALDVSFPFGLLEIEKDGDRDSQWVDFRVEYRVAGSGGAWLRPALKNDDQDVDNKGNGEFRVTGRTPEAVTETVRFDVAEGQYEVRMTRLSQTGADGSGNGKVELDRSYWTCLRSFTTDIPVVQEGVCLLAIRMQASDQLNGVPQQISALVESYLPELSDPNTFTLSRSPARAFADVLRRRGGEAYIADERIDIATLTSWDADCAATAPNAAEAMWSYDDVIEGGSVYDALRKIASAGRAAYTMRDGKFSVVRDRPQPTPVQVITPKNSWGYRGSRAFVDLPHALRMEFRNAEADYRVDERVVFMDGYDEETATKYEVMPAIGATSPTQVWREGRYHLAVGYLRPEEHQVSMDIEGLRCTLGDRVQLAHDVMLVGLMQGRVLSASATIVQLDEEIHVELGKTYQLRVRHANGTQTVRTVTGEFGIGFYRAVQGDFSDGLTQPGDLYLFGESGLESAPMIVKRIEAGDELSVTLTMANYDDAIHTADTSAIPPFLSFLESAVDSTPPGVPTIALRSDETVRAVLQGGSIISRFAVDIAPPPISRTPLEGYEVMFQEDGSAFWSPTGTLLWPVGTPTVFINGKVGTAYRARVRSKAVNGLYSDWVEAGPITVLGTTLPVQPPTVLSLTPGYREIYVRWTNPTDASFAFVEVLASTSADPGTAVVVGFSASGTFTHAGLAPGITYHYWGRTVDTSGDTSGLVTFGSAAGLSIALYEGIGSDNVLHPQEKLLVIREFSQLSTEKPGLELQATQLGIVNEKAAYTSAYNTLSSYLGGLSPAYTNTSAATSINRTTWNSNWSALYAARQALLNRIDALSATLSSTSANDLLNDNFDPTYWLYVSAGGQARLARNNSDGFHIGYAPFCYEWPVYTGGGANGLVSTFPFKHTVAPGKAYHCGLWVQKNAGVPDDAELLFGMYFYDAAGASIAFNGEEFSVLGADLAVGAPPKFFTAAFFAPANAVQGIMWVQATVYSGTPAGKWRFERPLMSSIDPNADVTSMIVAPGIVSVYYDYLGTTFQSADDISLRVQTSGGGTHTSGVVMAYTVLSGTFNGFTAASGPQAITVTNGEGVITPTSLATDTALLQIDATLNGRSVNAEQIQVNKVRGANPAPGGGGTDVPSQSSGFTPILTNSFTTITNTLTFTLPTGKTTLRCFVDLQTRMLPKDADQQGPWNVEFKVLRGGVDQGSVQNSNPDPVINEIDIGDGGGGTWTASSPGTMSYVLDMGGLTAGVQYSVTVQARISSGTLPSTPAGVDLNFTGKVELSAP